MGDPRRRRNRPTAARDASTVGIAEALDASAYPVNENSPLTSTVNGLSRVGVTGLEPVTSSLSILTETRLHRSSEASMAAFTRSPR